MAEKQEVVAAITDPGEVGRAEHNRGDRFMIAVGNLAAWLFPLLILAICIQVVIRQAGHNQAWLDDLQWWLYGVAVLVGIGYAVTTNSHVRVDIFYDNFAKRKQMIVDVAHSSLQVVREVLAMTERPLVVSHTGIHSHCQAKRNIPDDLMQQIAARGGLIAIGYWEEVTCDASPAGVAGAIIAAVALVGVDHVSLGSDFDGAVETTFDTSELAALTHELQVQGMADADIAAVMGGNMVRFLREMLPQ